MFTACVCSDTMITVFPDGHMIDAPLPALSYSAFVDGYLSEVRSTDVAIRRLDVVKLRVSVRNERITAVSILSTDTSLWEAYHTLEPCDYFIELSGIGAVCTGGGETLMVLAFYGHIKGEGDE